MLIGGEMLQHFLRLASIRLFGLLGPLIIFFDSQQLGIQVKAWCKPKIPNRAEIGTATLRSAMSVFNTTTDLPTREELGERAFDTIRFWMEEGHSQLLSREQALQIAVWGLKSAGAGQETITEVIADLVELPDNLG